VVHARALSQRPGCSAAACGTPLRAIAHRLANPAGISKQENRITIGVAALNLPESEILRIQKHIKVFRFRYAQDREVAE
ncbi:MAG: hypothetical protein C0607_04710, partial [Azoarcus sp.]